MGRAGARRTSSCALDADEAKWLLVARETGAHRELGYGSFTEYLQRRLGYAPRTARERIRVAEKLTQLPQLRAALARGDLAWSAVRELTRVAEPATEADLIAEAMGKTVREIEEQIAGNEPRLRKLTLDLQPQVYAQFLEAKRMLAAQTGGSLDDSAVMAALCQTLLEGGASDEGETRPRHQLAVTVGVVLTGASPIGVLVVYRAVGFSIYKVPSSSMMPTVAIGQRLIVNRLAYVLEDPTPGDVITFGNPCAPAKVFVKRVVALAGDSVEVRCSFLYVNDVAVPEVLVEEAACAYDDFDAFSDRWSRPGCARYREQLGGSHDTFHDEERPARDRELDAARRDGTATYFDPNYDVGFADDHDFPRLPDPEPGRLRMQTSAGPELPRCPTSQERRPPELLGHVEVLTSAAGEPPKWEPWLDRPWPAAGFPGPADACAPRARYRVPPGAVFVLGDNRDNASDSRVWGPVPRSMVTGEVVLIVGAGGP